MVDKSSPDLARLMKSLVAFRVDVGFYLMDDIPPSEEISTPLWKAFEIVHQVIESIKLEYGYVEDDGTIFSSPE